MQFVATCLFGLEKFLGEEIDALGYKRVETIDGRVIFEGDIDAIPRSNMWLRCAERVFVLLDRFPAPTFDALFEGTKKIDWAEWIGKLDCFPVSGHSVKSALTSIPDCQKIVKKAIVEKLKLSYNISWFEETDTTYTIEFFILKDEAFIMLDTSGIALHKRGYRPASGAAPLRETLAAALVKLARPRENVLLVDPFCGSGTITIEAALIMTNTAPGTFRKFSSEEYSQIDNKLWKEAREEAYSLKQDTEFRAIASDIDPDMIKISNDNIKRAGMEEYITTKCDDALKIKTGGVRGTVICNPPYGERLMSRKEADELYRKMGKHFATLDSWQIYVITASENFEKLYGRKADKIRRLYNGMIPCNYYQYFKKQK